MHGMGETEETCLDAINNVQLLLLVDDVLSLDSIGHI